MNFLAFQIWLPFLVLTIPLPPISLFEVLRWAFEYERLIFFTYLSRSPSPKRKLAMVIHNPKIAMNVIFCPLFKLIYPKNILKLTNYKYKIWLKKKHNLVQIILKWESIYTF